ncbi:hypothetical protein [Streptomyces shenzhenensis]|nr:hypothetical protein [Streptomyces shenzhenensis]
MQPAGAVVSDRCNRLGLARPHVGHQLSLLFTEGASTSAGRA